MYWEPADVRSERTVAASGNADDLLVDDLRFADTLITVWYRTEFVVIESVEFYTNSSSNTNISYDNIASCSRQPTIVRRDDCWSQSAGISLLQRMYDWRPRDCDQRLNYASWLHDRTGAERRQTDTAWNGHLLSASRLDRRDSSSVSLNVRPRTEHRVSELTRRSFFAQWCAGLQRLDGTW